MQTEDRNSNIQDGADDSLGSPKTILNLILIGLILTLLIILIITLYEKQNLAMQLYNCYQSCPLALQLAGV